MRLGRDEGSMHKRGWNMLGALICEIALFAAIAPNFLSGSNFLEITRFSVELGLLAIALTPVLITGGIDLSVGSVMGLSAVVLGLVWRDWHLPLLVALLAALAVGCVSGTLNAFLISRLKLPALIVTL